MTLNGVVAVSAVFRRKWQASEPMHKHRTVCGGRKCSPNTLVLFDNTQLIAIFEICGVWNVDVSACVCASPSACDLSISFFSVALQCFMLALYDNRLTRDALLQAAWVWSASIQIHVSYIGLRFLQCEQSVSLISEARSKLMPPSLANNNN